MLKTEMTNFTKNGHCYTCLNISDWCGMFVLNWRACEKDTSPGTFVWQYL